MVTSMERKRARSSAPLFALGLCIGLLVVPLVKGNTGARAGALAGLVAIIAALAVGVRRLRRVEYGEAVQAPPLVELAKEAVSGLGRYFVYMAGYIAFVFVAVVAPASGERKDTWVGPVMAGLAGLALAAAMFDAARIHWRKEGVERQVFLESTCVAFFVTVVASAVYALFEVLAGAPTISMWAVWSLGMITWAAFTSVRTRRLS